MSSELRDAAGKLLAKLDITEGKLNAWCNSMVAQHQYENHDDAEYRRLKAIFDSAVAYAKRKRDSTGYSTAILGSLAGVSRYTWRDEYENYFRRGDYIFAGEISIDANRVYVIVLETPLYWRRIADKELGKAAKLMKKFGFNFDDLIEKHELVTKVIPKHPPYLLTIQTDWDFSVKFRGKLYTDYEFSIPMYSPNELDQLLIGSGFGGGDYVPIAKSNAKIWELQEAIEKIKANPDTHFDNTGGNRGCAWQVING